MFFASLLLALLPAACTPKGSTPGSSGTADGKPEHLVTLGLARIRTLDPALSEDMASGLAVGHLYDRLLQYDYLARPYVLKPAMAAAMPEVSADGLTVTFHLKPGLKFAADPCFPNAASREVTARDVVVSLLRLADTRLHSQGYWILRDRLVGLDAFRTATAAAAPNDLRPYDTLVPGLSAPDATTVVFKLTGPYPQLLHVLAMPFASVVPERAVKQYGARLAEHAVGSGPFVVSDWQRNYCFKMRRNPDYRLEQDPLGRGPLPLVDTVTCLVVQEQLASWLLFLQGALEQTTLSQENMDAVLGTTGQLPPDLVARGVTMTATPEFQINYIGFNSRDPVLGANLKLRQAISLAYDINKRLQLANRQLVPAQGPIPPGVPGYDPDFRSTLRLQPVGVGAGQEQDPRRRQDVERARQLLAEAGYPGGKDPATGKPLRLRFDLGGTSTTQQKQAELMTLDLKELGIELEAGLNNWPKMLAKLNAGDVQMFRLSWIGDYPDGQNFLQLFYGPNAGICNHTRYQTAAFDALYEQSLQLYDGPERNALYRQMQSLVVADAAWIFESYPVTYRLSQPWVSGAMPHNFCYDPWKYLGTDPAQKTQAKAAFRPLRMNTQ